MRTTIFLLFFLIVSLRAACQELRIAVAANAQFVTRALKEAFDRETGAKTTLVISSSGKLTAQIRQGAPFDIFLSADMKYPQSLYENGYAANKPKIYAYGKLVLWTLSEVDLPHPPDALLTSPKIKTIAVANPRTAPYGVATVAALKHSGVYNQVKSKLVYGESVAQVNHYLLSGVADIGFTAKSVVLSPQLKKKGHWVEMDHSLYKPIAQGAVILKKTHSEMAQKFFRFLYSKEAESLFKQYGYLIK